MPAPPLPLLLIPLGEFMLVPAAPAPVPMVPAAPPWVPVPGVMPGEPAWV
jgi:hypothetical protein